MSDSAPNVQIVDAGPPPPAVDAGQTTNQPTNPTPDSNNEPSIPTLDAIRQNASAADQMIRAMREAAERGVAPDQMPPAQPPSPVPALTMPTDTPDAAELRRRAEAAEHDARTWRGRVEAERERAAAEAAELRRQLAEVNGKKAREGLDAVLDDGAAQALSQEEVENYGPEMLEAFWRFMHPRIRQMVAQTVEGLRAEIAQAVAPIAEQAGFAVQTSHQTARDKFFERMTELVPTWTTMENDRGFNDWLDQKDAMFGVVRREPLDKAVSNLDADAVAVFFNAYLDQRGGRAGGAPVGGNGSSAASGPAPAQPAPGASQPEPRPTLADFAAPGTTRAPAAPSQEASGQAKRWTGTEIRKFYGDVARGLWAARPTEKERIEREIGLAQRNGLVDLAA